MNTYTTSRKTQFALLLPVVTGLALAASTGIARSAVTISSDVSFSSGIYTYSYNITNFGTVFDIATIDLPIAPGVVITNLSAPAGFGIISDQVPVSLVSLFEDSDPSTTASFAPNSTIGTFSFQSSTPPSLVTFSALDVNGDTYTGLTQSAVPEPSSMLFLASTLLPILASRSRRHER